MRGVKIKGEPPKAWQDAAKVITEQLRAAEATVLPLNVYKFQLLSDNVKLSDFPKLGKELFAVGVIEGRIHVRVFDGDLKLLADAQQPKRDHDSSIFSELVNLLKDNWDAAKLKPLEVKELFRIAETIVRRFLTKEIIEKNKKLWTDDRVRDWLLNQFNNKCWYSEAQDSVSSIHVDHFRPKGRVSDEKSKVICEGYWWLAFDWTNYRIGGQLLNVKKSDVFPFSDATRASHDENDGLKKECPVLLDPLLEDEARLISFDWHDEETCVAVVAGGVSPGKIERAERTIEVLGLNRLPRLNSKRAQHWDKCKMVIADYEGATGPQCFALIEQAKARATLKEMIHYDSEFSSIAEACIRKNSPEPLIAAVFSHS